MTLDNPKRNPTDRMDLPFVGLATFAGQPAQIYRNGDENVSTPLFSQ